MKQLNIASYGAGVDSTAMILKMIEKKIPIDQVVFADTGGELPETYNTVEYMKKFLEKKDIPFKTVRNFGLVTLFNKCITRKVFPDMFKRWCTRDFKVGPIHKFYKTIYKGFKINEYIGIDVAETRRCRTAKEDYITKHYPLVDWKMDRLDCERYIFEKGFPYVIKSGCYFCPFNSLLRWDYIKKKHPKLYRMCKKLEKQSKHYAKGMRLIKQNKRTDDVCGNGFS
ncbi:MAG: phosphoadenosine phosphosulfate reductase family protein [Deltaproteobacteria bacterium]|nr:phosphoadenosine phosphosulfate reductase family protein [Deltaproteobacteria bacterium]